jgi:FkbM family methyltransferase
MFVSYSQNLEDVMLWRALKHINQGFYVDVGANDPHELSVTKAFYQRGWHGINIDPITCELLNEERERDINLSFAIGPAEGEMTFYEIGFSALSTSDAKLAEKYRNEGHSVSEKRVRSLPMSFILGQYADKDIHFMNIDVEGAELEVLQSFDLSVWRPWILLVESTIPNTRIPSYESWEPLLFDAAYKFVHFDGLNRFYVADERSELVDAFELPPNMFDLYIPSALETAQRKIQEQNHELEEKKEIIRLYQTSYAHWILYGPATWLRKLNFIFVIIQKVRLFLRKFLNGF